ncbi:hypothetical protein EBB79_23650 (plasmid) [Parasedimentitalea marina]|uniref:Sarcosine oxidase subunit gamma n=1 Tax=Parasedimentitalea marina TaxID=2483033 RepID=A0A3T0NAD0_9RHOB|nr:hypothetical protein [Parasedimentitalea marina]AZV80925.1 hypothetical protein EBB79_23650 [Parasedimentitalea marina]
MLDVLSPLGNAQKFGRFGAECAAGPGVCLSETRLTSLVQVAGWGDFEERVMPGLKSLGFGDAGDFRKCRVSRDIQLFRISPDRILLASLSPVRLPGTLQSSGSLAMLDVGHARSSIVIEGSSAEEVMARLAPVDFREAAMPTGDFVQTGIHHVGVLIHRTSATRFEILTPVTWARSLWDFICLNAAPFGYDVKGAT